MNFFTTTQRRGRTIPRTILLIALSVLASACGNGTPAATAQTPQTTSQLPGYLQRSQPRPNPLTVDTSFPEAGCTFEGIPQSMSGSISACYRIPNLQPGNYWLAVNQVLPQRGTLAKDSGFPTSNAQGNSGPAVTLSLSPPNGPAGSEVLLHGVVAATLNPLPPVANFCWAGCVNGLQYDGVSIAWTGKHTFSASIVTPSGPWIDGATDHLTYPNVGYYRISTQCLELFRGCGLGTSEGSSVFHVTHAPPPVTDQLHLNSPFVFPGQVVKVTGSVPLLNVIGSSQSFIFQFSLSSKPIPTYHLVTSAKVAGQAAFVDLGAVEVSVIPATSLKNHPIIAPKNIQVGGLSDIAVNSNLPGLVFSCTGGGIVETRNGVNTMLSVASVTKALGDPSIPSPGCNSVVDSLGASGNVILGASFISPSALSYGPPYTLLPFVSTDTGQTWAPIPVPTGLQKSDFLGFAPGTQALTALFLSKSPEPVAESTLNGQTWTYGPMGCPQSGPCITYGGVSFGNCAMNGSPQQIYYRPNLHGQLQQLSWPNPVNSCFETELFTAGKDEYLLATSSSYPLRMSSDGGAHWEVVSGIPTLPGSSPGIAQDSAETVLPNGSLLATTSNGEMYLLGNNDRWCRASVPNKPSYFGPYLVPGRTHVYYNYYDKGGTVLGSISDTQIHCG